MGDSDDEFDRRRGRDKFRGERNEFQRRDDRRGGGGGNWEESKRGEWSGRDRNFDQRQRRFSPQRLNDSPPQKRVRRDWDGDGNNADQGATWGSGGTGDSQAGGFGNQQKQYVEVDLWHQDNPTNYMQTQKNIDARAPEDRGNPGRRMPAGGHLVSDNFLPPTSNTNVQADKLSYSVSKFEEIPNFTSDQKQVNLMSAIQNLYSVMGGASTQPPSTSLISQTQKTETGGDIFEETDERIPADKELSKHFNFARTVVGYPNVKEYKDDWAVKSKNKHRNIASLLTVQPSTRYDPLNSPWAPSLNANVDSIYNTPLFSEKEPQPPKFTYKETEKLENVMRHNVLVLSTISWWLKGISEILSDVMDVLKKNSLSEEERLAALSDCNTLNEIIRLIFNAQQHMAGLNVRMLCFTVTKLRDSYLDHMNIPDSLKLELRCTDFHLGELFDPALLEKAKEIGRKWTSPNANKGNVRNEGSSNIFQPYSGKSAMQTSGTRNMSVHGTATPNRVRFQSRYTANSGSRGLMSSVRSPHWNTSMREGRRPLFDRPTTQNKAKTSKKTNSRKDSEKSTADISNDQEKKCANDKKSPPKGVAVTYNSRESNLGNKQADGDNKTLEKEKKKKKKRKGKDPLDKDTKIDKETDKKRDVLKSNSSFTKFDRYKAAEDEDSSDGDFDDESIKVREEDADNESIKPNDNDGETENAKGQLQDLETVGDP